MRRLRLTFIISVILLSGCIVIPTYNGKFSLKATHPNEQDVQLNNVLLIGTGPVASRVFLEKLAEEMNKSFKSKGIQSKFSYLGKIPQRYQLKLDSLADGKFDTYLVFKSGDSSYLDMTKEQFTAMGPGVVGTGYGNQYKNLYTVTLYTKKDGMQMIWQGDLNVDFDLANDYRYKKVAKLIFGEFAKNHILVN